MELHLKKKQDGQENQGYNQFVRDFLNSKLVNPTKIQYINDDWQIVEVGDAISQAEVKAAFKERFPTRANGDEWKSSDLGVKINNVVNRAANCPFMKAEEDNTTYIVRIEKVKSAQLNQSSVTDEEEEVPSSQDEESDD